MNYPSIYPSIDSLSNHLSPYYAHTRRRGGSLRSARRRYLSIYREIYLKYLSIHIEI